jgi:hypothetical protein
MSESFTLGAAPHKTFGVLATLAVPGHPDRRFTREEALIVSRALNAVDEGESPERQIYMSPIASDHDFDAQVGENGVVLTAEQRSGAALDWNETRRLAQALATFGGE